jgi:Ca2+-binding RTX toxin-like protein
MIRTLSFALGLACCLSLAPAAIAKKPRVNYSGARVLTVTGGDRDNQISVYCAADGNVRVNNRNPVGGAVGCGHIAEIDVISKGGDDVIRLGGVDSRFGEAEFEGFGKGTGVAVIGGLGADRVVGSNSAFNLILGEEGADKASGGRRRDILSGGAGNDRLAGRGGPDRLLGKVGKDKLNGGSGPDLLSGNGGNDFLFGSGGGDLLGGGPGMDRLRGGRGPDTLVGGLDRDSLAGGPGRDHLYQTKPPS